MAPVPLLFGLGTAISAVGQAVGGIQKAKAAIAQGEAEKAAALKNAVLLEDQAEFLELKTEEEVARFERIRNDVNASVISSAGASGIQISGSVLDVIASNAITTQRDTDIVRLSGERESQNLRTQADIVREQGISALSNAQLVAKAERLGGFVGGVGTVASAFGPSLIGGNGLSSLRSSGFGGSGAGAGAGIFKLPNPSRIGGASGGFIGAGNLLKRTR
jgi:hypothetical protein